MRVCARRILFLVLFYVGIGVAQPAPDSAPMRFPALVQQGFCAIHLLGLRGVEALSSGTMQMTPEVLEFISPDIRALISYRRIISVRRGSDRPHPERLPDAASPQRMVHVCAASITAIPAPELVFIHYRDVSGASQLAVMVLQLRDAIELQTQIEAYQDSPTARDPILD